MDTPQGSWTIVAGGQRGTLTADQQGLNVSLGGTQQTFAWSRLDLEFPTSYSVRLVENGEQAVALGFSSTAEAQSFRHAVSPPDATPHEERTAVMTAVKRSSGPQLPGGVIARVFLLGVLLQLLGGLFVAVFWGSAVGVGAGVLLLWAGGIPLLAAIVAWGVRTGRAAR